MSGATVVSGCWLIESVNNGAQTGTLFGSTFAGGDSYVSGGQMLTTPPNGGAIAASAPTNIVQYRSNNSYPYCSTDGKTFNELALPGAPTYGLITGISGNGTDVTFTTAAAVNVPILTNFNQFTVAGANPSAYNGTYTAISGTSGNTVVAASATVTPYVSGGVLAPVRTGSAIAFSTPAQTVVADRVTSNLFYLYNYDAGIYQIQNCGAPVLVNNGSLTNNALASQKFGVFSNGGTRMKSVPSEAGHFVYSIGGQGAAGAASHPFGQGMWRSCNGGFLMQQFPDLFEVIALGFGPPASGKTYPSEYIVGWYSASNTVATGVFGVYRSIDDPNNGVAPTATYNASISGTALTINSLTSGTVSTGDTVYGVGVTTGTTISSGSGSSWVVNNSQTVASESMVSNGSCTVNTQTWQQLTTPYGQGGNTQTWPIGWMSGKSDITGVLGQYGLIYLGNNAGFVYGYFPYLLNRDLDPSSNDNSPAFLSRAA